jgi:hypothetical protein
MASKSLFPIMLKGLQPNSLGSYIPKFLPYTTVQMYLDNETLVNFASIYFDVVDAVAEKDMEYLE